MLKIKLINEQATLNNFNYVEVKEYIPNQAFDLKFQLMDSETKQRLIPDAAGTVEVVFQKRDGTELTKSATKLFDPDDRSMWEVSLSAAESNDIVGSNFRVDLDFAGDDSDMRSGMAYGSLSKITFDGEC